MAKFAVIVFPGSNCDHDCHHALKKVLNQESKLLWHQETDLDSFDCIVIPGGFSYGCAPGLVNCCVVWAQGRVFSAVCLREWFCSSFGS